jgi:phenylalanyl-tRNA synthetase beta chain
MNVLLSWLNDFAPFGDDADAIAAQLSQLGMAVESTTVVGTAIDGVIVAKVLERAKHPNADRIGLVFVDVGDGQSLQICCGAFNMQPGDLVPLATIGTTMPDGRAIARSKMRGEWSNGMLCSPSELGLADDDERDRGGGIYLLPADLPVGAPVFEALGVTHDVVFELDLTRNRPECWGHEGVARDLAAHLGLPFRAPGSPDAAVPSGPELVATVEIVDGDRCGRFTSTVITGVEVGPSPAWMADRLSRAGMRPINNVVDVSNYVMLELNAPNHAYDLATLGGGGFRVRLARDGEQLVTLDGVARTLTADDLLICDANDAPIGLAGIMGGEHTEIAPTTTAVALEVAWFEPAGITRTVGRTGLRSEASVRFERGRDPEALTRAVARFVELLRETCPKLAVAAGAVHARATRPPPVLVTLRTARVNMVLGTALTTGEIAALIAPIGFVRDGEASADTQTITVPSWRPDCATEIDLVEEVARQYGFAKLGRALPQSTGHGGLSPRQADRRLLGQVMVGAGLTEVMPNAFLAPGDLTRAGLPATALTITNPLVTEESVLRTSLRPGLLTSVGYNASHRRTGAALFEMGHVYRLPAAPQPLPDEREVLAAALAGEDATAAVALWHELAAALMIDAPVSLRAAEPPGLHPTRSAELVAGGTVIGLVGEVDPDVAAVFGVDERVAWLEVDLDLLLALPHGTPHYRRVSRFPSSDIDLAFSTPDTVTAAALGDAMRAAAGDLLVDLQLFDVYRGEGVPGGSRSLAWRLRLQAADRTLVDTDVAAVRDACIAAASDIGATLRA